MKSTVKDLIHQQRIMLDKLSKKLGMSFYPVFKKNEFAGYLTGLKKVIPVEAKIRSFSSTTFESTLIEFKMAFKLNKSSKSKNFTSAWYVEFFTDNKAIVFDLTTIPTEWCVENCNEVTLKSGKKKIGKKVAFIPYELGMLVDLSIDRPQPEPIIYKEDMERTEKVLYACTQLF